MNLNGSGKRMNDEPILDYQEVSRTLFSFNCKKLALLQK